MYFDRSRVSQSICFDARLEIVFFSRDTDFHLFRGNDTTRPYTSSNPTRQLCIRPFSILFHPHSALSGIVLANPLNTAIQSFHSFLHRRYPGVLEGYTTFSAKVSPEMGMYCIAISLLHRRASSTLGNFSVCISRHLLISELANFQPWESRSPAATRRAKKASILRLESHLSLWIPTFLG